MENTEEIMTNTSSCGSISYENVVPHVWGILSVYAAIYNVKEIRDAKWRYIKGVTLHQFVEASKNMTSEEYRAAVEREDAQSAEDQIYAAMNVESLTVEEIYEREGVDKSTMLQITLNPASEDKLHDKFFPKLDYVYDEDADGKRHGVTFYILDAREGTHNSWEAIAAYTVRF